MLITVPQDDTGVSAFNGVVMRAQAIATPALTKVAKLHCLTALFLRDMAEAPAAVSNRPEISSCHQIVLINTGGPQATLTLSL